MEETRDTRYGCTTSVGDLIGSFQRNAGMLSNPDDLLVVSDLTTIQISISVTGPVGMSRCSAIWIFLSVWLSGVFGGSPSKALKCCTHFAFRFSADLPFISDNASERLRTLTFQYFPFLGLGVGFFEAVRPKHVVHETILWPEPPTVENEEKAWQFRTLFFHLLRTRM